MAEIGIIIKGYDVRDKETEVSATISRIEKDFRLVRKNDKYERREMHNVYVDYEFHGRVYKDVMYNNYSRTMNEGETIKIRIDENNPGVIYYSNSNILMGIIMIVIGSIILFLILKSNREIE